MRSFTIVGPDLTQADIWATAIFVTGPDGTDRLPFGYDSFIILPEDTTLETPGFNAYRATAESRQHHNMCS